MNVGSLFSGIGGIELGFEREGFTTEWFIEKELYCQAILRKHFQGKPIYTDIETVDWTRLRRVFCFTGGFPCQDISQAGKGEGITGKRSGLWKAYKKGIGILRPSVAIIENVPMLYKRGLNVIIADLAEMGYDAEWFTLSAKELGALHLRERLFIIAYSCEFGQIYFKAEKQSVEGREQTFIEIAPGFITYDWQERVQRFKQEEVYRKPGLSWCKDVREIEDLRNRPNIPEPLFCGSSDGIPYWMDRVGCCGNAVVPQVAQFIARRLKEIIWKQ